MLEYLNFFLLCTIFTSILYLYIRIKKYFPILKVAEERIGNLGYGVPQSDTKHQKLLECILTGNSKLYLGKVYTEEQLAKLNEEEVEKLFNNYEAKLSGQMVKSLGKSIIDMYSMEACSVLGITNQEALSEDLENDPFLNSFLNSFFLKLFRSFLFLQRFTCELYYRFRSFLVSLSVGIITSRHYLSKRNKNGERTIGTGDDKNGIDEKTEVIGSFIGMGMVGFCFGIGLMLAVKTVNSLECCINRKCL